MSPANVAKLVAILMAAHPGAWGVTKHTSAVYERMLADLDYEIAGVAVEWLLATHKKLPTIAEIREAVATLSLGEQRPGADAWGAVRRAIHEVGAHRRAPAFSDPVVGECVSALGWAELCNSENLTADRARFVELYDRLAGARRRDKVTASLPRVRQFRELRANEPRQLADLIPRALGEGT